VRVIATTNRDLTTEIAAGRFREDLFYRLAVVPIRVPPLKERREDVPLFARHFMARAIETTGMAPRDLSEDTLAAMQAYDWPGNVRELRNLMDWLLIMAPGESREAIRPEMLPPQIGSAAPAVLTLDRSSEIMTLPLRDAREVFERQYLEAQLLRFGGNISRTANFVGMERSALHRKLKFLGVQAEDRTPSTPTN
jgi:two-component system nitrogen regulation response regulator NtrX